ncbi:MAG TPA: YibE/F family protein [Planococcus sp. (in: firmicutes)]|nr:YibE/F family protein [Planococcus sp. (in: firmicutes)]
MTSKQIWLYAILFFCFAGSLVFVYNNHSFYDRPIAEVVEATLVDTSETIDMHNNEDILFTQHLIARLKNGEEQGQLIELTNEYTLSGAFDNEFRPGNEVFVSIEEEPAESGSLTGLIEDVKRDTYLMIVTWVFIFTLLIIGRKQGMFSVVSLALNAVILSYALDVYLNTSGVSLLFVSGISVVLFTVTSLLLVNGFNEKTYAAIVATLLGTFVALLIAYLAMVVTAEEGLRYEEMGFLSRPPQVVFLAGLFIGSLGAVMDVAITMSASIFSLYEKNNNISAKALKNSGMEIGKDIMGTMTNILFFAYISGSIPMLILYLTNSTPLMFTLSMTLSLEMARALAGGIGIVLAIPIGLYTTLFFVNRKRARV